MNKYTDAIEIMKGILMASVISGIIPMAIIVGICLML